MSLGAQELFDDLGGKFEARVRAHTVSYLKAQVRGSEVTLRSSTAVLEARFDLEVLDRLHSPSFIGIERPTASNPETYLVYEVVGVRATHLQELGITVSMPRVLREEFLATIEKGWGEAGDNWIDVVCVHTGYLAKAVGGEVEFERTTLSPLTGKRAHLLSKRAVEEFLCTEDGVEVGEVMGSGVRMTARIDAMVRYHTGIFGFTGSGKSNLASVLIRKAVEEIPGLRVVVFDVAGEYAVNLLDLLHSGNGIVATTEEEIVADPENLVRSQIIPESLEEALGGAGKVENTLKAIHSEGKVYLLKLEEHGLLVRDIVDFLASASQSDKPSAAAAKVALGELRRVIAGNNLSEEDPLSRVAAANRKAADELAKVLEKFGRRIHEKSSEAKGVELLLSLLKAAPEEAEPEAERALSPEKLAELVLSEKAPTLAVLYIPEPIKARVAAARYVNRLLLLKKKGFSRVNTLTVFDEAQEFIPDRARKEDYTEDSNLAVEALLRHGRKYRAGCWISTQRVAHLNVNALQQLHTYFAGTLPRYYDRMVIADAYSLDYEVLNRVAELDTGEWLFVSYKAAKRKNVPVFIKAPNNEEILANHLRRLE